MGASHMSMNSICWSLGLSLYLAGALGCSLWTTEASFPGTPKLPRPRMSRDSVGLEIATVTMDVNRGGELEEIIRQLDEQVVALHQRRHLAANGIRVGSLDTQLPDPIRLLLLEAADRREHPTAETFHGGRDQQRHIQCRAGKRYVVPLWSLSEVEVPHFDGDTSLRTPYRDAVSQIALRCTSSRSQRATIQLTPEMEHGPLRQAFVSEGSGFHLEARRDQETFDDLSMELTLRPGETVMVTCSEATTGFGQSIFRSADARQQKILLVRLAQTQLDDLFGSEQDEHLSTMQP